MFLTIIYILIPNALTSGKDKSILVLQVVFEYINSNGVNYSSPYLQVALGYINSIGQLTVIVMEPIVLQTLLVLIFHMLVLILVLIVIRKYGLMPGAFIPAYLYYLLQFIRYIIETGLNCLGLLVILSSIASLVFLYHNINTKASFINTLAILYWSPDRMYYIYISIVSAIMVRLSRSYLIYGIRLSNMDYIPYVFVVFSLLIPTIILSRIVYSVLY